MIRWRRTRKGDARGGQPGEGMVLHLESACQEENRIYTLLLKGVLVYLFVMGGMGCFLSALQVEYAKWTLHMVIFLIAVFCSMLYYNKYWENIGYSILLAVIIAGGSGLKDYINSGFYSVANDMTKAASDFFGTSAMRSYGEQIADRYLAVTVSMCYIGCVCCILVNILIARKMRYGLAAFFSIGMLLMPLYLELEPDGLYAAMLFSGIAAAYAIRGNGHYRTTGNNAVYEYLPEKKRISYLYDARTLAGLLAAVFLVSFFFIRLMSLVYPKERFQESSVMSGLKKNTMDTVENISILGLMGLFNFYPNTGGLTSGTLGGVSSVRLDFQTDLTIEFAPYSNARLYFKTFTGEEYFPYRNLWSRPVDGNGQALMQEDEVVYRLKERYERGAEHSAKGIMRITNVAAPAGAYLPYYSEDIDKVLYFGQTKEYTYYPRVSMESLYGLDEDGLERWLYIPEQNWEAVADFCSEAGLIPYHTDAMEAAGRLALYYQENIPYTLRPGLTPYRKDFINYFLTENRRGYCAHYASAATLIFRYLGIPARYVEGYAIDPSDIADNGELLDAARYEDYYDGYSLLGTEAVVSVAVTDADAHAWVEIYVEELGWQAVEVTPAADDEEEGAESIWQRLLRFLTGDRDSVQEEEQLEEAQEETAFTQETGKMAGRLLIIALIALIMMPIGRRLIGKMAKMRRYRLADRNGKLIMRYQEYIRGMTRKRRELAGMVNYEQQVRWLAAEQYWMADEKAVLECIRILEQAGFSPREISEKEYEYVEQYMCLRRKDRG